MLRIPTLQYRPAQKRELSEKDTVLSFSIHNEYPAVITSAALLIFAIVGFPSEDYARIYLFTPLHVLAVSTDTHGILSVQNYMHYMVFGY